ncbi:MAG: hypothetical protein Q8P90_02370, partial [bacterium]|nr:hypothetical protein [bacterium]
MAVAEVKKIQLVGINKHRDNILNLLQNTAAVELIGETESEVVVQSLEYDIAQIAYAINFVSEHFDEKVPMIEKIRGGKYRLSKEEIEKIVEDFDYKSITNELTDIGTNLTAVNNLIEKNTEEIELLQPWMELTAAPIEFQDTKLTGILLGTISTANFDELKVRLREIKDDVEITLVSKDEKDSRIMVVFSKTVISELTKLLEEHKFETTSLPHQENIPKETIDRLTKEIETTEIEREALEKKICDFGKDIKNLKILHDFLTWQLSQKSAERFVE